MFYHEVYFLISFVSGNNKFLHLINLLNLIVKKYLQKIASMTFKMWIEKLWYIHTVEYDSAIKKWVIKTWRGLKRNFKCILLNKISQSEKATSVRFNHMTSGKRETVKISSCQGSWRGADDQVIEVFRAVKLLCILFNSEMIYFPDLVNKCWLKELTF